MSSIHRTTTLSFFIGERQGTRTLTLEIVKDIKFAFRGFQPFYYYSYINDTLVQLANYDLAIKSNDTVLSQRFLLEVFDFLNDIGEYSLAYEFSVRPFDFKSFNLDQDSLLMSLPLDTVKESNYPDNANRLGYFDKNSKCTDKYLY